MAFSNRKAQKRGALLLSKRIADEEFSTCLTWLCKSLDFLINLRISRPFYLDVSYVFSDSKKNVIVICQIMAFPKKASWILKRDLHKITSFSKQAPKLKTTLALTIII